MTEPTGGLGFGLMFNGTLRTRLVSDKLDIQIARTFHYGRTRIQPFVEIFNLPNFSTVLTVNETVGTHYFEPGTIVQGRRLQIGGRVDW